MNMAAIETKQVLKEAAAGGVRTFVPPGSARRVHINTYNLHEILAEKAPITANDLQYLIQCQATLHHATAQNDSYKLKELLKNQAHSIRGFVLATDLGAPVAYAIYYPMIDKDGQRVAYCEDFFIVESYRGTGVAKILFHELAKRTLEENAEYLIWATDKRNTPVHDFVQNKLGAKRENITTLDVGPIVEKAAIPSIKEEWKKVAFESRPIKSNDIDLLAHHKFPPKLIREIGDIDFKGMLTFNKQDDSLRAITLGWTHTSTFRQSHGLHFEEPIFVNGNIDPDNKIQFDPEAMKGYVESIALAAEKMMAKKRDNLTHVRWHVITDAPLHKHLAGEFGSKVDTMLDTEESELIVYSLTNGSLTRLADNAPSRDIFISNTAPIGFKPARS